MPPYTYPIHTRTIYDYKVKIDFINSLLFIKNYLYEYIKKIDNKY
jgi:hypothetical protein